MASSVEHFDPFHVWLGIPPQEQPPNHYRLLGIRPFEPNPDVIDNMANQRAAHLETFRSGKHGKLAEQLLERVTAARICLLNPERREPYDQQLRAKLAAKAATVPPPQPDARQPTPAIIEPSSRASSPETVRSSPPQASPGHLVGGAQPPVSPNFSSMPPTKSDPRTLAGVPVLAIAVGAITALLVALGVGYALTHRGGGDSKPGPTSVGGATASTDSGPVTDQSVLSGTLVVPLAATDRSGVTLMVDGHPYWPPTSGDWEIHCPPGQHSIRATRLNFKPIDTVVHVAADQRLPLELAWSAATETYLVFNWPVTERAGGQLLLDGRALPLADPELKISVLPGPHKVLFLRPGFQRDTQAVEVVSGSSATVAPRWNLTPGNVAASKIPTGSLHVDLLAAVNPQRDSVRGRWRDENGALTCDPGGPAIITLPFAPTGDFTVTMTVERTFGNDSISLAVPVDGHLSCVGIDNFPNLGGFTGVELIDNQRVNQNPLSHHGMVLTTGQPCKLVFLVTQKLLTLTADGTSVFQWHDPDYSTCSIFGMFKAADPQRLSIITWASSYRISQLEVTGVGKQSSRASTTDDVAGASNPVRPGVAVIPPTTPKSPVDRTNPFLDSTADKHPAATAPTESTKPKPKSPPPPDADLAKANKSIAELYRDEIKRAATPLQKIEVAKKLLDLGLASNDDLAGKFALLKTAAEMAATQSDLDTMQRAVDGLVDQFVFDSLKLQTDLLLACAKTQQNAADCSAKLNALVDDLVAADRYDLARRSMSAALALKVEPAIHKLTIAHSKQLTETEAEFKKLSASIETLKTNPEDADANLSVGKFDCLVKGVWDAGLPLLAKGSDKALADLAKLDLNLPSDSAELVKLADSWWDMAKKPARQHALEIYDAAVEELTGIVRIRVEKRMEEAGFLRGQHKRAVGAPATPVSPTSGPTSTDSAKKSVAWTDLLKLIDPEKHTANGAWTKESAGLACPKTESYCTVKLPVEPGDNFDLKIEFTRNEGTGEIGVYMPLGAERDCHVVLCAGGAASGIDFIDGHDVFTGPTAKPSKFESGQRHVMEVRLRTKGDQVDIRGRLDDTEFTSFQGDVAKFTGHPYYKAFNTPRWPAISTLWSPYLIHSIQYRTATP